MNWISYFKIWQTHTVTFSYPLIYIGVLLLLIGSITACSDKTVEVKAKIGEKAPAFTLTLLDGTSVAVGSQPNNEPSETPANKLIETPHSEAPHIKSAHIEEPHKAVVLTFMSSWCPCSKESIPLLKQARERYSKDDIDFYLIGIQDSKTKFLKFVDKHQLTFPAAYDNGEWIAGTYGVTAPPTTVFIDKEGTLQRIFYGNIKDLDKELFQWFEEIL